MNDGSVKVQFIRAMAIEAIQVAKQLGEGLHPCARGRGAIQVAEFTESRLTIYWWKKGSPSDFPEDSYRMLITADGGFAVNYFIMRWGIILQEVEVHTVQMEMQQRMKEALDRRNRRPWWKLWSHVPAARESDVAAWAPKELT